MQIKLRRHAEKLYHKKRIGQEDPLRNDPLREGIRTLRRPGRDRYHGQPGLRREVPQKDIHPGFQKMVRGLDEEYAPEPGSHE